MLALFSKESRRFLKVWIQTISSPVVLGVLYFTVFGGALGSRIDSIHSVSYLVFIIPGLLVLQGTTTAFQNPSSSIVTSRYHNALNDWILPPLTATEKVLATVASAIFRGMLVVAILFLVCWALVDDWSVKSPLMFGVSLLLGTWFFANLGLLCGLLCKSFDQITAINSFLLLPMSFFSGAFYSLEMIPEAGRWLTYLNPLFYSVDLAKYAIHGGNDLHWILTLLIGVGMSLATMGLCVLAFFFSWGLRK